MKVRLIADWPYQLNLNAANHRLSEARQPAAVALSGSSWPNEFRFPIVRLLLDDFLTHAKRYPEMRKGRHLSDALVEESVRQRTDQLLDCFDRRFAWCR